MKKNKNKYLKPKTTSLLKTDFYKNSLVILACAFGIYFLRNESGPLRFLVVGLMLMILYRLIFLIQSAPEILEEFFPPKVEFEVETKPFDRIVYKTSSYFFFLSMIMMLFQIRRIDNTIHGINLFFKFGLYGALFGFIVLYILKLISSTIYDTGNRRFAITFISIVGFFLVTAATASFVNYNFPKEKPKSSTYLIKRKSLGGKRNNDHLLFIEFYKNDEERIEVSENEYNTVKEGEKVNLTTQKGYFGYETIIDIKSIN